MKTISKFGWYGLAAGLAVSMVGCQGPTVIKADYAVPAQKIADVKKVDVLQLNVSANVRGRLAGDAACNAALVRQLLSMKLYKTGFYRVTDEIWGGEQGSDKIGLLLADAAESGHGYASYSSGGSYSASELCPKCGTICPEHKDTPQGMKVKAALDVELDLVLDGKEIERTENFSLATTSYTVVPAKEVKGVSVPPTSVPAGTTAQQQQVKRTSFACAAKGVLKARISGLKGNDAPVKYETKIDILLPRMVLDSEPTQLKLLAEAVSPAVDQLVAEIAPHTVTTGTAMFKKQFGSAPGFGDIVKNGGFLASRNGDLRVVTLLESLAFDEAIDFVSELIRCNKVQADDLVNYGIALEVTGDHARAEKAYKRATQMNPESAEAAAGVKRMKVILSGAATIAASGNQNKDTSFSK